MKGAPIHYVLLVSGAWLATLGACGRTAPRVEDTYGYAASGDEGNVGATGGTSRGGSSGNATSTGGSRTGGTGGSSTGGSFTTGGVSGNSTSVGGSAIDDGGTSFVGGSGGNVSVGGSNTGGSRTGGTGGTTGGTGGTGGTTGGTGGTTGGTGGTTGGTGGTTGGTGGSMTMPPPGGGITCGDVSCDPETSICCQVRSSGSTCQPPDAECMGATLECSGPGSCDPGEVCCYHARHGACQATCEVSQGSMGNPPTIVLCDSTSDCGPDQTCVAAPRGIAYCGDNQ